MYCECHLKWYNNFYLTVRLFYNSKHPTLNKGHMLTLIYLPLLDHGAHLVTGEVHAMEVGEAVLALHVFCDQLEFAEGHLIVLQISQTDLEHTSLQTIRGNS